MPQELTPAQRLTQIEKLLESTIKLSQRTAVKIDANVETTKTNAEAIQANAEAIAAQDTKIDRLTQNIDRATEIWRW